VSDLLQETIDYTAICRLQSAYADSVSRRAWSELEDLFVPSATITVDTVSSAPIEIVGPTALGDFISGAVERFEFFELVILNTRVDLRHGGDADTARARQFTCELRQDLSNGRWTNAFGVYHDEYARLDERWWFARRRYQSLARTGRAEIFPFPQQPGLD
jgi:SnoaL-like domain